MKMILFSIASFYCIAAVFQGPALKTNKQQSYSELKNLKPVDGTVFNEPEARKPLLFTWTQVIPKRKVDVVYKIRVVEIKKGQSRAEALKSNKPVDLLEVKNQTQATSKLSKRCNGCEYLWNVEASKKSQLGDIEILGTSEATGFSIKMAASNPKTSSPQ